MSGIYYLSSLTGADFAGAPNFLFADKIVHAGMYFGLVLLFFPWRGCAWEPWEWLPLAIGVGLTFALCDEFHQCFVAGRHWEWGDLAADFAGITAATLFCSWRWLRLRVCRIFFKVEWGGAGG